jgi:hypothetical protein
MNIITVSMKGGLGNQLFQYAMGRALASRHKATLELDIYGFKKDHFFKRNFELMAFDLAGNIAVSNNPVKFQLGRLISRFPLLCKIISSWCLIEPLENYNQFLDFLGPKQLTKDLYVYGNWQNEKYFDQIQASLKEEFSLREPFSILNQDIHILISEAPNPVSIHIRRNHNLPSPASTKSAVNSRKVRDGVTLGMDYYDKAVSFLKSKLPRPTFFIFSDDPQWAKENFKIKGETIFLENGRGPDYEDILLMSACNHHVIANSSFSWWGAWLSDNEKKIVIAPKNALLMPSIPENWITIDN